MEKTKLLLIAHKKTAILIAAVSLLLFGGIFAFQKINSNKSPLEEADLNFDSEGPFALLYPRRDGNALILNLKRTSSYDSISYELAYTSNPEEVAVEGGMVKGNMEDREGGLGAIDRGVQGTIETKDKRGEYEQEILFGTCSKNVCKYDKGVENGTLTLHIRKRNNVYRMITQWHMQKPDVALGILTSGDNHFTYKAEGDKNALNAVGFIIINDLTGIPKLPSGKEVAGKVYALNVPIAKNLQAGQVTYELAENPSSDARIYRYNDSESKWEELDSKIDNSKLSAKANSGGIFAVLISK